MKITYRWLGEFIDLTWDWRELVQRLTMSGPETKSVEDLAEGLRHVVVGQVLACKPHPRADRLSVCTVELGNQTAEVVCGAPNVAAGQKVPVALPGARLAGGLQIEAARIRGVLSAGMICAEDELGLGDDHRGIMVLDPALVPGTPLAEALGLDDVVLEFEVTPNRPDCLSAMGLAREVRALTGAAVRLPPVELAPGGPACRDSVQIRIEAPADCPRYVGQVVRGVRVGPSPAWLQRRLRAIGQRPINNVVDVTNYVLFELGQPLHAFDLSRLDGAQIVVRRARSGERLETLDGQLRALDEEVLVIADAAQPVALAGIMGGSASQVSEQTTDILIEGAYFERRRVRAGAKRLAVSTEASLRFERGVDWAMTPVAVARAAHLIARLAGGQPAPEPIDAIVAPLETPTVRLRAARANALLATSLTAAQMAATLRRLGCTVALEGPVLQVQVPSYRPDLQREVDLIEEVGRIHGYDGIEGRAAARGEWLRPPTVAQRLERELCQRAVGLGFDEVTTNTVIEQRWLELAGESGALALANPPSEALSRLRTALCTSLLDVARRNLRRRLDRVAIFEIGTCFRQEAGQRAHREYRRLGLLWIGRATRSTWQADQRDVDLLDLKGALEDLLDGRNLRLVPADSPMLRPGRSTRVEVEGVPCGILGEVNPPLASWFDLDRPAHIFELELDALAQVWAQPRPSFRPLPKYPAIERDLAVVVPESVTWECICQHVRAASPALLESVALFDVYRGGQIPPGHKSMAFSVCLRSATGTLEDRQADGEMARIVARLSAEVGAELRQ